MGGFEVRCRLSDEEIIEKYLRLKIEGDSSSIPRFIVELDEELYTLEPWLLPRVTDPILNPREWFYFGQRNRKYRAEGVHCEGSWSLDDGCVPIYSEETGDQIGATTRFRYHYRNKGDKVAMMEASYWFMREYRLYNKERRTYNAREVFCIITCNDHSFV